jgi:hypothetical protein
MTEPVLERTHPLSNVLSYGLVRITSRPFRLWRVRSKVEPTSGC